MSRPHRCQGGGRRKALLLPALGAAFAALLGASLASAEEEAEKTSRWLLELRAEDRTRLETHWLTSVENTRLAERVRSARRSGELPASGPLRLELDTRNEQWALRASGTPTRPSRLRLEGSGLPGKLVGALSTGEDGRLALDGLLLLEGWLRDISGLLSAAPASGVSPWHRLRGDDPPAVELILRFRAWPERKLLPESIAALLPKKAPRDGLFPPQLYLALLPVADPSGAPVRAACLRESEDAAAQAWLDRAAAVWGQRNGIHFDVTTELGIPVTHAIQPGAEAPSYAVFAGFACLASRPEGVRYFIEKVLATPPPPQDSASEQAAAQLRIHGKALDAVRAGLARGWSLPVPAPGHLGSLRLDLDAASDGKLAIRLEALPAKGATP